MASDLDWTPAVLYSVVSVIVAIGMGAAMLMMTGSMIAAIGTVGVLLFMGSSMGVLPLYVMITYLIFAGGWAVSARSM